MLNALDILVHVLSCWESRSRRGDNDREVKLQILDQRLRFYAGGVSSNWRGLKEISARTISRKFLTPQKLIPTQIMLGGGIGLGVLLEPRE
jgi:hypothetical protein